MSERVTDNSLYSKLINYNANTKGTLLDINSLGAGGSRNHLIIANTQDKLGNLMTNSELWDLIDSIGSFEYANNLQIENSIPEFMEEYQRLQTPKAKADVCFIQDLINSKLNKDFREKIFGLDFKGGLEN